MTANVLFFAGIAREDVYSPGKVDADRAILEETARALEDRGVRARLFSPDRVAEGSKADLVFAMCQGADALGTLRSLGSGGVPVVHEADAIKACHRTRMVTATAASGIGRPRARVVLTASPVADLDRWITSCNDGVWVKRGDVHATEAGDVVRATGPREAYSVLAALARRGIERAVVEEHIEGQTIKFYAVRGTGFFRAYEADSGRAVSGDHDGWPALCDRAAAALGLEIYGGDLVITEKGGAVLVDMNDWPSFSPCLSDAAGSIADRLIDRRGARPPDGRKK